MIEYHHNKERDMRLAILAVLAAAGTVSAQQPRVMLVPVQVPVATVPMQMPGPGTVTKVTRTTTTTTSSSTPPAATVTAVPVQAVPVGVTRLPWTPVRNLLRAIGGM